MVEVFITSIQETIPAKRMVNVLENDFPELRFNVDLYNSESDFPCSHAILRVEGRAINAEAIITTVNKLGCKCAVLADKICK
jgi:hypothetical protein